MNYEKGGNPKAETQLGAVAALEADAAADIELGRRLVAAYRAKGALGVLPLLGEAGVDLRKTVSDARAAQIKDGLKTSEFWLCAVAGAGPLIAVATGHAVDGTSTVTGAALAAIYAACRAALKMGRGN
jgi:hypothetical protein